MRYLLIGLLPPVLGGAEVGGVASIIPNWAKHLAAIKGNELYLWAPAINPTSPGLIPNVSILPWLYRDRNPISLVKHYGLSNIGLSLIGELLTKASQSKINFWLNRFPYSRSYFDIKKAVKRVRPDVVNDQLFSWYALTCQAAVHAVDPSIPIIISVHGIHLNQMSLDELPEEEKVKYMAQAKKIFAKTDYILFSSTYNLDYSKNHGLLDGINHYTVITDGVDTALFDEISKGKSQQILGLDPRYRYILFVGNLLPRKGCHLLLEAFARVAQNLSDIVLIIIGDGPEKENLNKQINDLRLGERVHFEGAVPDFKRLVMWYKACDIYVLPSQSEGLSISILEAMSAGLPVISCRPPVGSYESLREGETCLLADYGNIQQLSAMIEMLLMNTQLANMLAKNAAHLMREEFDWKVRASAMDRLTQDIVEQKRQIMRLEANH